MQAFSIMDLFHYLPPGSGLIQIKGQLWRVFPDGTLCRGTKERWRWNGSSFDEQSGSFNGVAVVWQNVHAREYPHVYVWLPLLNSWDGIGTYQRGILMASDFVTTIARVQGDVCAPLVLLCALFSDAVPGVSSEHGTEK